MRAIVRVLVCSAGTMHGCAALMSVQNQHSAFDTHQVVSGQATGLPRRRLGVSFPLRAFALLLVSARTPAAAWQASVLHSHTPAAHRQKLRNWRSSPAVASAGDDDKETSDFLSADDKLRLERARLGHEWWKGVGARRPRFLPFVAARKWARAMHFTEESDWREWIENGEKRNAYIPSRPDEVYAQAGWAGWDDFLNGSLEDISDAQNPNYKRGRWLRGPLAKHSREQRDEQEADEP
mmetsp:Transcript_82712/g.146115  ORF Transcript_82712/g.146115 Transcript_82712/m.146115 type:complete len:237 (+) Transcript_82712:79-789(+)